MIKKRIAIVTATRAEYGLLTPLIRRVLEEKELELDLIVTGGHLSEKQGMTIKTIQEDGFSIDHKIPILHEENTPYGISITMANAIEGFAECFRDDRPDMVVILGDRTEMLGVASAAMNERIPIAHIHGGEVTQGAVDDCIRHAITKMSYLHFTSTEQYRKRVIQLGENPDRVFNVGSLGTENILSYELYNKKEWEAQFADLAGCCADRYAVVTYHPETLEDERIDTQVGELCKVMEENPTIYFLITGANADSGGDIINELFQDYCDSHENACFLYSLGIKRYLSAIKYATFVMGNSSSGVMEAPVLGTPTINIGDRQRGRIMPETVIQCRPDCFDIMKAIEKAKQMKHISSNLFGDGLTSARIVSTVKEFLLQDRINLKKEFYDLAR